YYICISLGDDLLKIAQVKGSLKSCKVLNVVSVDVKGMSDADLPKTVQSALSGFNTKKSIAVSVVPPSMVTTKNIEVPSTNPDEIKSIVGLQAGRHTPFSRDEIQVGFVNIGVYKSNYSKILLVIANKNVLKHQLEVFEKAGIKIEKVLFAPEGIAGLYSDALGLKNEAIPKGIIDVDENSTNFVIAFHGISISSRSVPIGKIQLAKEGETAINKLVDEIKMTLDLYINEDIEPAPAQYLITNEDEHTKALQAALKEKLNWAVEFVPYVDNVKATSSSIKKIANNYPNASFLDIISSASIVQDIQVDLMPEEVLMQRSLEEQGKELFKAATTGFIILFLVALTLGLRIYFKSTYLNKLQSKYKANREEVVKLEEDSKQTKIIQKYLAGRMVSLETIRELYYNIPDSVYLTNVFLDEDGSVSIQGVSEIASLVFNLGTTLKESALFKSVEIKSTTSKKDRGKDVSAFEITLKLKSFADDDDTKTENTEE
ncbi:MAG: pilus assembly protein PilM, partial [Candidatus Omnitrophica bacterium]|nr:pilus assembly protein PilM [Candidatus Omnitrophota bacterium]MBU1996262.1 pilus assembly protein PilM [Candidatus Omnitrophota bacterium]